MILKENMSSMRMGGDLSDLKVGIPAICPCR